jgi:outer membrane protein TolC
MRIGWFFLVCLSGALASKILGQNVTPPSAIELTPAYINELGEQMRTNNPGLRALESRVGAAAANVASVKTWDDPMATVGVMGAKRMMREQEGDLLYGAEQKLPLFGRPRAARRAASAEQGVAQAAADYKFQALRLELARTLFRAALAAEEVVVGQEDLVWLETMAQIAESKYRSSQASLTEVLQVQNERARRESSLKSQTAAVEVESAALNRLLNLAPETSWPVFRLPMPAAGVPFNQRLLDLALRYEPRTLQMREEIKQADAELERTRRERFPEVSVGAEGRNYGGDGRFRQSMVTLSVSLPWFNRSKYQAAIKRDGLKVEASRQDLEDYELSLAEELRRLTVKIENARREAVLYREDILPRSQTALESARAGWESGRGVLRDLLEARRMLLEARVMKARATAEQYEMLAELVLCCGIADLEALIMVGAGVEPEPETKSK